MLADESLSAHCQDVFVEDGGFLVLVQLLSALGASDDDLESGSSSQGPAGTAATRDKCDLFSTLLSILCLAIVGDNAKHLGDFEAAIGWEGLAAALGLTGLQWSSPSVYFDALLGLATGDVRAWTAASASSDETGKEQFNEDLLRQIRLPHAVGILVSRALSADIDPALELRIAKSLLNISQVSVRNQSAIHDARITDLILSRICSASRPISEAAVVWLDLLRMLYTTTGLPDREGAMLLRTILFNSLTSADPLYSLLLHLSEHPPRSNSTTFDMSTHGHSSIAISSLRRPFPPTGNSTGWSFCTTFWAHTADPSQAIELLHVFDAQRSCSVKLYIDAETDCLHYQARKELQPVQFAGYRFTELDRPYNVAFVQQRPRDDAETSLAQLYVDGNLVEQQRCPWSATPLGSGSPVRAVIGTAPPLTTGEDAGPSSHRDNQQVWSIGTAWFIDSALPSHFPLILHELGADYSANFQDSLGRFLTYQASTAINLRLDVVARNLQKEGTPSASAERDLARHALVTAIAGRSSDLFDEDRFYFVLDASSTATKQFRSPAATTDPRPGPTVLLNRAVTLTREALAASYGYAKVYGEPVFCCPSRLGDVIWKAGGSSVLLAIIDQATDSADLTRALTIFCSQLRSSWKLCEDAESVRAYETLNMFLRQKSSLITLDALSILLEAVGIRPGNRSALVNPFLYRVVFLDFTLWSMASREVQVAYFGHFDLLLKTSLQRKFNIKRITKMPIIRKLLYCLQTGPELWPQMLEALKTVLLVSWTEASLRSVTSYLATSLCRSGKQKAAETPQSRRRTATLGALSPAKNGKSDQNAPMNVALHVFQLLHSLALDRPSFLQRFGQSVSIKWMLLFFHPNSCPQAAVLSLDLLTQLCLRQKGFIERLSSSGGWNVMERLLPAYWEEPTVVPLCFCILFGQERDPNTSLLQAFADAEEAHCPAILKVILGCLREAMRTPSDRIDQPKRARDASNTLKSLDTIAALPPTSKHRHTRSRSASMTLDAASLAEGFKQNSQQAMIKDITSLIQQHAQQSAVWQELLINTSTLRLLLDALEPQIVTAEEAASERNDFTASEACCDDLLTLFTRLATDQLLEGSMSRMVNLLSSVPPRDLARQGTIRLNLFSKLLSHVQQAIASKETLFTTASLQAFAGFLEQASHLSQGGVTRFDHELFDTVADLLLRAEEDPSLASASTNAIAILHSSLNRMALARMSDIDCDSTPHGLHTILHYQSLFLRTNTDRSFIECLTNRLFHFVTLLEEDRSSCLDLFKLIALSQPKIAEQSIIEGTTIDEILQFDVDQLRAFARPAEGGHLPYQQSWEDHLQTVEAVRTALHLERVGQLRQLLDLSETRDKSIASTERRMLSWHASVCASEADRHLKHSIDSQELQQSAAASWQRMGDELRGERALLGKEDDEYQRIWQLDPIEGPRRMRKRLMEQPRSLEVSHEAPVRALTGSVDVEEETVNSIQHGDAWGSTASDLASAGDALVAEPEPMQLPTSGSGPLSSPLDATASVEALQNPSANPVAIDDDHEYKFRKVLRSLERGDRVDGVVNASRVVGVDLRAALCITGQLSLYLVDDYFQRPSNGELVNVWQAPEAERDAHVLATLASDSDQPSSLIAQLEGEGQTRKWSWSALRRVHRRAFLHRNTALECFFDDGQSCLLVLPTETEANALYKNFGSRCRSAITGTEQMRDGIREPPAAVSTEGIGGFGARLGAAIRGQTAGVITEAWRARKISNFDYLIKLNTLAGRSFNDLSQYPVFPWILSDYTSEELDLSDPASFRRLGLPMGAQTTERSKQFKERYESLVEIHETPFHYGTHFSTAATTAGYLIRLRPFEKLLIALQGGSFDLAERTFSSIEKAWRSASEISRGDIRELTPEFFYLPEFLVNRNRFDFGSTQAGSKIDDVELPPWAKGDPVLFIQKHREALESDYVSAYLHLWIDLVFGYKQSGPEAVEALNVFHPLSYPGEVDLENIQDPNERRAACSTVWNFGVTPSKLFERPHVARHPVSSQETTLSLHTTPWLAIQNVAPLRTIKSACHFIYTHKPEKAFASPQDYLILPKLGVSLSTGHLDGSIRMFKSTDVAKPVAIAEQAGVTPITCLIQASATTVLTGCRDGLVLLWKIDVAKEEVILQHPFRGHTAGVTCLASSQSWRIAVSGSEDGTAIVWDSNRGQFVRSLRGNMNNNPSGVAEPVTQVAVDEEEGYIATASGQDVYLWDLNGLLLAHVEASSRLSDPISSMAFISKDSHVGRLSILLTGHKGKVVAWSCEHKQEQVTGTVSVDSKMGRSSSSPRLAWRLLPFHVFEHREAPPVANSSPSRNRRASAITAIALSPDHHHLFTGDSHGRLNVFSLLGEAFPLPDTASDICMDCNKKWGMLESKRSCKGCGRLACSNCCMAIKSNGGNGMIGGGARFCRSCREICLAAG